MNSTSNNSGSFELPSAGDLIAGRYLVLDELGRGGMGIVYRVEQVFLNSIQALKVLTAINATSVARFQKEAQITQRLKHENLVGVTDLGTLPNGSPFLVMDYVEGIALSQMLREQGALPVTRTLEIYIQICEGLAFAHENGIVHRDLKPSNFMLAKASAADPEYSTVKIIDFGIARILQTEENGAHQLTRTGDVLGSPLYMSPEQCSGLQTDERSDIYSFGCSLFETLTGVPPFRADSALATMREHQVSPIPTLKAVAGGRSEFSEVLESIIQQLLAKNPSDRFQTIRAVRAGLESLQSGKPAARKTKPVSPILLAFMLLTLIGVVAFFATRIFLGALDTGPPKIKEDNGVGLLIDTIDTCKEPDTTEIKDANLTTPFSDLSFAEAQAKGLPVVFTFPEYSLGVMDMLGNINKKMMEQGGPKPVSVQARGTVILKSPQPFFFEADAHIISHPQLFRRFRPNELWKLSLGDAYFDSVNDETLFCLDHLTGLRQLSLPTQACVTSKGFQAIAGLKHLNSLRFKENSIPAEEFAAAPWLGNLQGLHLSKVKGDLSQLVKALSLSKRLRTLELKDSGLKDADLIELAKCESLEILDLGKSSGVTGSAFAKLRQIPRLKALYVQGCPIESKYIAELNQFPFLQAIDLGSESLTDADLLLLNSKNIDYLAITNAPKITNQSLNCLKNLPNVHELRIFRCPLTPECLQIFRSIPTIKTLKSVELPNEALWNATDESELRQLVAPGGRVRFKG